jgi:hypothetical protein
MQSIVLDLSNPVIQTYPKYYSIYLRYMKGENVKTELDSLYNGLFTETILPNYCDLMYGIDQIDNLIQKNYENELPYAILDYLEFIFGNILYETFYYGIKQIPFESINQIHLGVFKYIIHVEKYKFEIYKKIIVELDLESKFLPIMVKRSYNCELKISFGLKILSDYSSIDVNNTIINECEQIIKNTDIELRMGVIKNATSFIKLSSNK